MELGKYSMGVGDRFGYECAAQLRALQKAAAEGVSITPVWNKSHREHTIAGTAPGDARRAADEAVRECGWRGAYYVDADHLGLSTVDAFLPTHDFFTIDLAEGIGRPADSARAALFFKAMAPHKGSLRLPGMESPLEITNADLENFARTYLHAVCEAGAVYRHIAEKKGTDAFITEISADEAPNPQTPAELLLLLAAVAMEGIPVQTIAPKFSGAFLKGIDYVGDPGVFAREFENDLAVIAFAVREFDLPGNLKLSIHTGSDKFSLYPLMHRAIRRAGAGIHLKTAGTTWLEELAGLAASGGEGLDLAKEIYQKSYMRLDELCRPYLAVTAIDRNRLPLPAEVSAWSGEDFVMALRHDPSSARYNPHLRQLLHVGFRIAAETGPRFVRLLQECRGAIEEGVTRNLYENHIRPLFLAGSRG